jgi:hypothetical protein
MPLLAHELFGFRLDVCLAGLLGRGTEALILLRSQPGLGRQLGRGQRRAGGERVELRTRVDLRSPSRRVLLQRWLDDRCALEHQSLPEADHAIDDRPLKQTSGLGHNAPTEAGQPTSIMESVEESLRICAVLGHDEDVNSGRAI